MFLLKQSVSVLGCNARSLSISSHLYAARNKNHYDSLGISPKATQADVKSAYYELSKIYHPDRNQGSEENAQKFRDITEAYEVLGNVRLRKMYDRGMYHGATKPIVKQEEEDDDPVAKFYKARERRHKVPQYGNTKVYDFDEWTREHYGRTFRRDQEIKAEKAFQERLKKEDEENRTYDTVLIGTIGVLIIASILFKEDYDDVSKDVKKITRNNK